MAYNQAMPVEMFDVIFIDECHRSIYTLWRKVLEYFDAFLVGLTATPSKQTFAFFNQNLVMEYGHDDAVADCVNVDFDVYKIRTRITEHGATVEAGPESFIGRRERMTRKLRWERLDDDITYGANQLDRDVVAVDQIRTVVTTFHDKLFTEIFPGRRDVPKTLVFAKGDSHADDIVRIMREEFGKGNDFCEKITYRSGTARVVTKVTDAEGVEREVVKYKSGGVSAEDMLSSFRVSYNPRIAVTAGRRRQGPLRARRLRGGLRERPHGHAAARARPDRGLREAARRRRAGQPRPRPFAHAGGTTRPAGPPAGQRGVRTADDHRWRGFAVGAGARHRRGSRP